MPLAFQDFWPRSTPARHGPGGLAWEPLAAVADRASRWLAESGWRALNVETLLMPAPPKQTFDPGQGGGAVRWDEDHVWVQVIRVWYEKTSAAAPAPQPGPPVADAVSVTGHPWPKLPPLPPGPAGA